MLWFVCLSASILCWHMNVVCVGICESEFICAEYQLIGFGCIFSFDMLMELGENFVGHGYIIDRSRAVSIHKCALYLQQSKKGMPASVPLYPSLSLSRSFSLLHSCSFIRSLIRSLIREGQTEWMNERTAATEMKRDMMMERWTAELILKCLMLMLFAILHALWTYQISRVKISIEYTK